MPEARTTPAPEAAPAECAFARLDALVASARARSAAAMPRVGLVYPCDALALAAAAGIASGIAQPLLIGPPEQIAKAADAAGIEVRDFEIVATGEGDAADAARRAVALARDGAIDALMKGALHTDELMSAVVNRNEGLRSERRISHAFVFDLPRYHKLLMLADCVVNIAPNLPTKIDILAGAIDLLRRLGVAEPKVGIVAAVETVNPSIPATLDAQTLVAEARQGRWGRVIVEGPFGFDNAFSAEAARIKKIQSQVAGDADLLLMPDLNAGNMLYKSFNYVGGGDCAGLVLGARVPIVVTSRADSMRARLASVALAVLAAASS